MTAIPVRQQPDTSHAAACPECGKPIADLETHLRQAHQVLQFRGKRYAEHELAPMLLAFALNPSPALDAWEQLTVIAVERLGAGATSFLVNGLTGALRNLDPARFDHTIGAFAEVVGGSPMAAQLIGGLAVSAERLPRRLALALGSRLPPPVPVALVDSLAPLLSDCDLPAEAQVDTVAALLRTTGSTGRAAQQLVEWLLANSGRGRALNRLELLEQRVGAIAPIVSARTQLEDQLRMRRPRCQAELRRKDMIGHLWGEHGLVLEGRRAREPWRIIEDLLDDYQRYEDAALLHRAGELAQRVDPEQGTRRFRRLLLSKQIDDPAALQELVAEAGQKLLSLCPHCFEFVPLPHDIEVPAMNVWRGRLSALGFSVAVDDSGLLAQLEIATPDHLLRSGPEPGNLLTRKGWLFLLAGLPIYAALLAACLLPGRGLLFIGPVCLLVVVGLVLSSVLGRKIDTAAVRSMRHAWEDLVPDLLDADSTVDELCFVASLAVLSEQRGWQQAPRNVLRRAESITSEMLDRGLPVASLLAAFQRLQLAEAAAAGSDPVPLLVKQVERCFTGQLPLRYAHHLVGVLQAPWWKGSDTPRLRVLLSASAFEAGLEVRNILEICQAAPALEQVFQTNNLRALALLRLLWSVRTTQPWQRYGSARTVFDIAAEPAAAPTLLEHPDLLLLYEDRQHPYVERSTGLPHPTHIVVGSAGVLVGDVLLSSPSNNTVVRRLRDEAVYELVLGSEAIRFAVDPTGLAARLERWLRFFFQEFKPQSSEVLRRDSGLESATLLAQQLVECPACHKKVFPSAGAVAQPLELGRTLEESGG